ncbi:apolipophorin-like protein, partial [Leptotrombidium deliense]
LAEIKVNGVANKDVTAKDLEREVLAFSFHSGKINHVYPSINERNDILNVKKSILSSLQMSEREIELQERDIIGDCKTVYLIKHNGDGSINIVKRKKLDTCLNRIHTNTMFFQNSILNRILEKSIGTMNDDYVCYQLLDSNGLINSVDCFETMVSNKYSSKNTIKLKLISSDHSLHESETETRKKESLLYKQTTDFEKNDHKAYEVLKSLCKSVKDDIGEDSLKHFHTLTFVLRGFDYDEVKKMVNRVDEEKGIGACKSMKLKSLLSSALLMSGGGGAMQYITEDFNKYSHEKLMTLLSLPFISNPNEESVKAMIPIIENSKQPKLLLFVTSLIGNFVRQKGRKDIPEVVNTALNILSQRIPDKCSVNEFKNEETVTILRSIANIHYSNAVLTIKLMSCAKNIEAPINIRVTALDALKNSEVCDETVEIDSDISLLIDRLMKNAGESDEIKIASYKLFTDCSAFNELFVVQESLKILKDNSNKRLAHYVYNYLMNVKKDTINDDELRSIVMEANLDFTPDNNELYSKNILHSMYSSKMQMGVQLEMDVIREKGMKNPKSVIISAKIPIRHKNVKLFEIGFSQKSDDKSLTTLIAAFQENRLESLMNFGKALFINTAESQNSEIASKLMEALYKFAYSVKHLSFYMKYNENTLFMDEYIAKQRLEKRDLHFNKMRPLFSKLAQIPIVSNLKKIFKERAVSWILVDSSLEISTVNGMPLIFNAKSMLVSTQNEAKDLSTIDVLPNFGISFSCSVQTFIKHNELISMEWKSSIITNPKVWMKIINDHREKRIEIITPKQITRLLKFSSGLIIQNQNGNVVANKMKTVESCTQEMFALKICTVSGFSSIFNIDTHQVFEVNLVKMSEVSDTLKASISLPAEVENKIHIQLLTPQANKNYFELMLKESEDEYHRYELKYKLNEKKIEGMFAYKIQKNKFEVKLDVDKNSELSKYEINAGWHLKSKLYEFYTQCSGSTLKYGRIEFDMGGTFEADKVIKKIEFQSRLKNDDNKWNIFSIRYDNKDKVNNIFKWMVGDDKLNRWYKIDLTAAHELDSVKLHGTFDFKTKQMTQAKSYKLNGEKKMNGNVDFAVLDSRRSNSKLVDLKLSRVGIVFHFTDDKIIHKTEMKGDWKSFEILTRTEKNGNLLMNGIMKRLSSKVQYIDLQAPKWFSLNYIVSNDIKHELTVFDKNNDLIHKTSFSQDEQSSEIDLKSKTPKFFDLKITGKFNSIANNKLNADVLLWNSLRITSNSQSSNDVNGFSLMFMTEDRIVEQNHRRKRGVSDEGYGLKAYRSVLNNGIVIQYTSPKVKLSFNTDGKQFNFTAISKDGEYLYQAVYTFIEPGTSQFVLHHKRKNDIVYSYKRFWSRNKFSVDIETPPLSLLFSNSYDAGLKDNDDKHETIFQFDYKQLEHKCQKRFNFTKLGNFKTAIIHHFVYHNQFDDPTKYYHLTATVTKTGYPLHTKIPFNSKDLINNCESNGIIEEEGREKLEMTYERKCGANTYTAKMSRIKTDHTYFNVLDVKKDGKDYFNVETKGEYKREGDTYTTTFKSIVKSPDARFDGKYFDFKYVKHYNRTSHSVLDFAIKPLFFDFTFTMKREATHNSGFIIPDNLQMTRTATLDLYKTGTKYKYTSKVDLRKKVHFENLLTKEVNGVESKIRSLEIMGLESNDDKRHFNFSLAYNYYPLDLIVGIKANGDNRHKGDRNFEILLNYDETKLIEIFIERRHEGEKQVIKYHGLFFGFPHVAKVSIARGIINVHKSIKPLIAGYKYPIPEKYQFTDCYEPSDEDCIDYAYEIDERYGLHFFNATIKINAKGKRYTQFIRFEKKRFDKMLERNLSITNNKNDERLGFYYLRGNTGNGYASDIKLFLHNKRVIRVHGEVKIKEMEFDSNFWLDLVRKPDQKLSIHAKVNQDNQNFDFKAEMKHPTLKKPVTLSGKVSTELQPIRTFTGKVVFDYSTNEKNKVYYDFKQISSSNETAKAIEMDVKLYTHDKRVDLSVTEKQLQVFEDFLTAGSFMRSYDWKSAIDPTQMKNVLYKLQYNFIRDNGIKITFNYLFKQLAYYMQIDGVIEKSIRENKNPVDLKITFSENGPSYRVNSTFPEDGCVKFNAYRNENDVIDSVKYLSFCDKKIDDLRTLMATVGDETSTAKRTVDIGVKVVRHPGKIRVEVNWDPYVVKKNLIDFTEKLNSNLQSFVQSCEEWEKEKEKIRNIIMHQFNEEVYVPLHEHIAAEFEHICVENEEMCDILKHVKNMRIKRNVVDSDRHDSYSEHISVRYSKPLLYQLIEVARIMRNIKLEIISYEPQKGQLIFEVQNI